jgi:hypothetical protein
MYPILLRPSTKFHFYKIMFFDWGTVIAKWLSYLRRIISHSWNNPGSRVLKMIHRNWVVFRNGDLNLTKT